ncbi:hypothetical protein HLB44_34840 [Aquincola sp. S2]|uniref:SAM-dependent methyltransferase n=1 Tax=Pseudaquabacterium terrae TaxID=2732868 RepID=A0ABX2EUS6_9BURK|nr:hypothetical protein [Aquabacterium terrae]NRF72174.1 hypothetical protein [Aquabacterium terrae]
MALLYLFGLMMVLATFAAVASIVRWTLQTGTPPMPSSSKARRAMMFAAATVPDAPLIELGSGCGTFAVRAARAFPNRQVIGYELSWLPWLISRALRKVLGLRNLVLLREDFLQAELPEGAVLLCYLSCGGMLRLAARLDAPGPLPAMLVSNTFRLPGRHANQEIRLDDLYRTRVYVYRFQHV